MRSFVDRYDKFMEIKVILRFLKGFDQGLSF